MKQETKNNIRLFLLILVLGALGMASPFILTGCTQQERVKQYGGTMTEDLPAGQKFVTLTWESTHLWIASRPAREGEKPEKIIVKESSNFGVYQGTIIVQEH